MTRLIAELGMSHGGSYARARDYVHKAAECGADLVKFQCHRGQQGDREWPDFTDHEWEKLAALCRACEVEFLCSPFSLEAATFLDPLVQRWKVASGQVTNIPMLTFMASTQKEVILSQGLGSLDELRQAAKVLGSSLSDMACLSVYPTPPEAYDMLDIGSGISLSDHSGTIWPGVLAAYNDAPYVEVHVKDTEAVGNDLASSITYRQLRALKQAIVFIHAIGTGTVDRQYVETMREQYLWRAENV